RDLWDRRSRPALLWSARPPIEPLCLRDAGSNASVPPRLGSSQSESATSCPLRDRLAEDECRRIDRKEVGRTIKSRFRVGRDGLRAVPFFSLLFGGQMVSRTARRPA